MANVTRYNPFNEVISLRDAMDRLSAPINSERAEANYADGVLTLNLPKAEHVKARTVKVTSNK